MLRKIRFGITAVFIVASLCLTFATPSHSSTSVFFENNGDITDLVTQFSFQIISPSFPAIDTGDFVPDTLPAGWDATNLFGNTSTWVTFGPAGTTLDTQRIGGFDGIDDPVTLGGWELTDINTSMPLILDTDYFVNFDGTDYTVTSVPIPPTVLLLGAGLMGLVGIRRRVKS